MTTRDFITKNYNVIGDTRQCSSVMASTNGTIYSYGSHYPLAFQIEGLDFINESGYSNTTRRHIHWAKQALDYDYIGVELSRQDVSDFNAWNATTRDKLTIMERALDRKARALIEELNAKTRRDTKLFRALETEVARTTINLNTVRAAL